MTKVSGPSRSTALVWAAIAEVVLAGAALALLVAFDADDGVPFGVPGAVAVLVAAIAVTAAGTALAASGAGGTRPVALGTALLVAVMAGLVAMLAIACFFASNGSVAGLGIPLVLAVVGMDVVAVRAAANRRQGVS